MRRCAAVSAALTAVVLLAAPTTPHPAAPASVAGVAGSWQVRPRVFPARASRDAPIRPLAPQPPTTVGTAVQTVVGPAPTAPPPHPAAAHQRSRQSQAPTSSPGGFLACVRHRESRGDYHAVNPRSGAGGAYQFLPSTWRKVAAHAGRPDLERILPQNASPADQDTMAEALLAWQGRAPWAGPGC